MLKKVVVGASALVLAGGAFMTAQALTTNGQSLPEVNAPLTVQPAGAQTTGRRRPPQPLDHAHRIRLHRHLQHPRPCRDDDHANGKDRHGRGSDDDAYGRHCHHLQTVVPSPSVFTDDVQRRPRRPRRSRARRRPRRPRRGRARRRPRRQHRR